jgi:hypothetical protein
MAGSDVFRSILSAFGIGELSDAVYQTYLNTGITDPDYLLLTQENTPTFQARFPGIRDAQGQLIMKPADYVNYERTIQSQLAQYGHAPLTRSELGAIVQSGRSADEVAQDLAAYDELRNNPYVQRQFYAYTGVDPGPEGLFALALGLPSAASLRQTYEQALSAGVPQQVYDLRLGISPENQATATVGSQFLPETLPQAPPGNTSGVPAAPAVNVYRQGLARMDRLRALQKAELANKAQFVSGGAVSTLPGGPSTPKPYSF